MILYDQNYNFIGMSNETLSYLGYEDLSDFTSQHSDFANLLVNKEGYIYKFENFSWIDFVLFSGSPNKSALLKLKNGDETEIKVSVKEVHLTNEMNNNSKFYSVRILTDNFVTVASKTDATIVKKSPPKNSFNLNSLITESEPVAKEEPVAQVNLAVDEEPSTAKSDFVLNFPDNDNLTKEEAPSIKLDLSEKKEESFILHSEDEQTSESGFKLQLAEETIPEVKKEIEVDEEKSDFVLTIEDAPENSFIKKEEVAEREEVDANLINFERKTFNEEQQEEEEEKITLNFLKPDPIQAEETVSLSTTQTEDTESKGLSFLMKSESTDTVEESPTPEKKEQIIAQIQNDIKEIDTIEEESTLQSIKDETVEVEENAMNTYLFNQNEVKKDSKSFTKTLASLFAETSQNESKDETLLDIHEEPTATLKKNEKKEETTFVVPQIVDEVPAPTALSSLGLDQEEEHALLLEFVHDTKTNIHTFKEFQRSENGTQAEYILIKMQSSASILNLHAIISSLDTIKQAYKNGHLEKIEPLTDRLELEIDTLEKSLESETV